MLRNTLPLFASLLVLAIAVPLLAADKLPLDKLAVEVAKADPDFAVQGEYVGDVETLDGVVKFGVQVIALGDAKFALVAYRGGLPGDGWDGSDKIAIDGATADSVATFVGEAIGTTVRIADGVLSVEDPDGKRASTLKKVCRKSPTLGAKAPDGAIVLFDGTTAEPFDGGRMTKDRLLMVGVTSKRKFQSFTLHMEFRTPYMPKARGQERGNSGFYAQGRYEVQILDSFGLEGRDNECGGIYQVGPPKVNMCLPPLTWQTYDVDYTAATYEDGKKVKNAMITVCHNGVVIHKDQKLPHATTAAPLGEAAAPGPIYLQNHNNPVCFRNIWVVEK